MVKASALGYAITFLLLVGLICSGVLFVASANKRLEVNYSIDEHMIFNNRFALNFGAAQQTECAFSLPHPSGDTSDIIVKNWGAFRVVEVNTHHINRSLVRSAMVGYQQDAKLASLYLPESNQALKICGDTRLEGTISVGSRGIDLAYIAGKNYTGEKRFYGEQLKSERHLPNIRTDFNNLTLESFYTDVNKISWLGNDSSYSFKNKTTLVSQLEPLIIDQKISGNIILHSFDSIYVRNTASLENVILIAPKIRFEKGFKGSLQAIAHNQLICEEDVSLMYPSVLVLNELKFNESVASNKILLQAKSKILGGVLLVSQSENFRNSIELTLQDALVAGFVYNQGSTQVIGKVIGHLYTRQFHLKSGGGGYTNHLLDATISSALLPKDFIYPNWIKSDEKLKPILLSCS